MKFLILASLFVLSVVAEPEAEPQHHTAGFVAYTNGALVPEDTDSVKAAKIQHLTAKAALYAHQMPLKYYQPQVYGVQHQQLLQVPRVGVLPHHVVAPQVYLGGSSQVYGHHVYQPHVYGLPALRHFGKREAEAEPEAEAEAEAQFMNYYGTPASTYPVTYASQTGFRYPYASAYTGYPTTTAYTGYPATTAYTGYPATTAYTGYPATTAYTGYPATTAYTGYPTTTAYKGYPYTYNTLPTTTFNTAYNTYGTYPYNFGKTPVVKN